jgi:hypothetical protein
VFGYIAIAAVVMLAVVLLVRIDTRRRARHHDLTGVDLDAWDRYSGDQGGYAAGIFGTPTKPGNLTGGM